MEIINNIKWKLNKQIIFNIMLAVMKTVKFREAHINKRMGRL